jgi:hypothetical protein
MVSAIDAARAIQERYGVTEPDIEEIESPGVRGSLQVPDGRKWPKPMAEEAFHGIVGEAVRTIIPHTEADPAAVLTNFLVYAGNIVGRGPHAIAEAARHGTNLFAVQVGETAKSRKGSANSHTRALFDSVDAEWTGNRIKSGLSSGEGLITAVRDATEKTEAVRDDGGKVTGEYQTIQVDAGVDDKRLLVIEPEFASVLKVMGRETNTLSTFLRQGWDSGTLRTMTKNNPAVATDAHISILGHVTKDELLRHLTDTEMGNGFANRFLWVYVKRAQVLPEGGGLPDYQSLIPRLQTAIKQARQVGELARNDPAKEMWAGIYEGLSDGKPGLFGAVAARAEAQVLRLSVVYAALDGAAAIHPPHLMAALAVWDYVEQSIRYIFGDATGDPIADRILESLSHFGEMTRTHISQLFHGNTKSARIDTALSLLATSKRAYLEMRPPEDGKGRSAEVWKLR